MKLDFLVKVNSLVLNDRLGLLGVRGNAFLISSQYCLRIFSKVGVEWRIGKRLWGREQAAFCCFATCLWMLLLKHAWFNLVVDCSRTREARRASISSLGWEITNSPMD